MQQNGASSSNGSGVGGGERESPSRSPLLPAATTRVRRFIQERRTLPLPKVMVVFSAAGDAEKASDAMADDDPRKPASPAVAATAAANVCRGKPSRYPLDARQEQEVGRWSDIYPKQFVFI